MSTRQPQGANGGHFAMNTILQNLASCSYRYPRLATLLIELQFHCHLQQLLGENISRDDPADLQVTFQSPAGSQFGNSPSLSCGHKAVKIPTSSSHMWINSASQPQPGGETLASTQCGPSVPAGTISGRTGRSDGRFCARPGQRSTPSFHPLQQSVGREQKVTRGDWRGIVAR